MKTTETITTSTQSEAPIIPPIQTNPDKPLQTATNPLLYVALAIGVLIIIGLIATIVLLQPKPPQIVDTPPAVLPTDLPMPTTAIILTPTLAPSITMTPTVKLTATPTIKQIPTNTDGNTFTSNALGISFFYAKTMGSDPNTSVKTMESGSKAYIYEASMQPTTGQSIERFPKSTSDTLAQAISKKFLAGIPTSDCFVKVNPTKPGPTITKATISYPIPTNADQPNFTYGDKCPEKYSESNGIAYFYEDSTYPDRFYYLSIGQYSIPAYNTKPNSAWQDTITVF